MLEQMTVDKEGWAQVAFGDVVEKVSDSGIPDAEESRMYIGLEHMSTDSNRIRSWGSDVDIVVAKTRIKKGDVLFARRNTHLRRCAVAPFSTFYSPDGYAFRTKSDKLSQEYLLYLVSSSAFMDFAVSNSAGTHSKRVKWTDLQRFEFLLPPIQEQARIVEVFMAFDASIDGLLTALENAQIVWRSFSRDEFGPRANKGGLLADHYSVQSGQVDPKKEVYKHLPLVGPNHIKQVVGSFLGADSAEDQNAISGKYLFEPDTVIYSKIRPELRKAFITDFRGLCSADMYPLIARPSILPKYLLDLVLSDAFSAYAISCSMRTGMPKLNREQLSGFEFDLPGLAHQEAYVSASTRIKEQSKEISNRLAKIVEMKTITLETLF